MSTSRKIAWITLAITIAGYAAGIFAPNEHIGLMAFGVAVPVNIVCALALKKSGIS